LGPPIVQKDGVKMDNIIITSIGPHRFHVQVREDEHKTRHYHVTVPDTLIDELRLPKDNLDKVVRESFVFLLAREPASSIMREFSLDIISNYFPEYKETLREQLESN
jgi:hypothetical protein